MKYIMYMDEDLQEYLDLHYPLDFEASANSLFADTPQGHATFARFQEQKRKMARDIFMAGYLAAFKRGNLSPNSELVVVGKSDILQQEVSDGDEES